MDSDLYQSVLRQGAWVDLSDRAKWRLSGADRVRYLNGQVTNDVRLAGPDAALHACVTNAKGRMEGDVFIHAEADSLWIDAPGGLREPLGVRLERYIIADDAVLEDVSDDWRLWHRIGGDHPAPERGIRCVQADRFGLPGWDCWLPAGAISHGLRPAPFPVLNPPEVDVFRILQHVPSWPAEINADAFPQEAGLEKSCMSYTKGCYIGQEVLSRIKTTGRMPRELASWEQVGGAEDVTAGRPLLLDGREVGRVTSCALHPVTGRWTGLASLRQGAATLDSVLRLGDALPSVDSQIKISAFLNQ